jgi:hypothetical protein
VSDAEAIDHAGLEADALLASILERQAVRVGLTAEDLRPEREAWRRAGKLWQVDLLAVPAVSAGAEVSVESADHRKMRARVPSVGPALDYFATFAVAGASLYWAHAKSENGAGTVRASYGQVVGWWEDTAGVHLRAVSCIEPRTDWSCSLGFTAAKDDDGLHDLRVVHEVSLLPPPLVPALPGARVLEVEPFEGTVDDVAWLGNLKPAALELVELCGDAEAPKRSRWYWPRWR